MAEREGGERERVNIYGLHVSPVPKVDRRVPDGKDYNALGD